MGYNYFDDDEVNVAREKSGEEIFKRIRERVNPGRLAQNAKYAVDDIIHGEAAREMRELPNVRNAMMKLLATVLFVVFILIFIIGFSHTIHSQNKKLSQFNTDAGKICTDIITQYGSVKWERLDSNTYGKDTARLTGLCYARQMDFDNDGSAELMLCYNDGRDYILEVYSYISKSFTKVYSAEANSTDNAKDGSWIGFYHKNNKYYICKSKKDTPEKVELYALKGDKFKKTDTCDYDYKNNIYSINGKINADDFETIKLSVIKSSRAEYITEIVADNLEEFSSVSLAVMENQKSDLEKKKDAYFEIVESRIDRYGEAKIKSESGRSYIDGVCYVNLIDFNNDENEELFIAYRKQVRQSATDYYTGNFIVVEEPTYCMEVYSWNGTVAKKIFSKDSVCNYLNDDTVNYVMFCKAGSITEICTNTYDKQTAYTYSATSKIYKLKKDKFETIHNVRMEEDYGYRNYYIDGEYCYSSQFQSEGYKVPMFLDDDGSYDSEKYTVTYLSGKKNYDYKKVVEGTVKVIQKLNSSYLPGE